MHELLLIVPLSFLMGFVTSISGGGGVFGVPTMLAFGIPPINALALNRVSDLGVLSGSLRNYMRVADFDLKMAIMVAIPLTVGGIFGAMFSVSVSTEVLQWVIIAAIFIGIVFLLYPVKPKPPDTKPNLYTGIPALLAVGVWSGAVAMAGATFAVLVLVLLFHRSYVGAKAIDTAAAVPETIISTIILAAHSTLGLTVPAAMFVASLAGAYAGSKLAIKKGSWFIRLGMVAVSLLMVAKVLLTNIFHVL